MVGSNKALTYKLGSVLVAIGVAMVWCLTSTMEGVDVKVEGDTHTYTYLWWIPTLILLGGLVSISFGLALRRRPSTHLRFALLFVVPFATSTFGLSMYFDRWVVGDQSFSIRTGLCGLNAINDVAYDDLARVRYYSLLNHGRGGGATHYLECIKHDGSSVRVPSGSACSKLATREILKHVGVRDIPIHNETHSMP